MALLIAVMALYLVMIAAFTAGYYRIVEHKPIPNQARNFISIVICFRNEAANIASLFETIQGLDYPTDYFEVVAVNDHSTDSTEHELAMQQRQVKNLHIINLPPEQEGKKAALSAGVSAAQSSIIAITDADCRLPKYWLANINNLIGAKADIVCGPVAYRPTTFFERLAAIEFASLNASGIGAAGVGMPIFCNAASMAFRKEIFTEANLNQEQTPSGDDVFLLHYAKQHHKKIMFIAGSSSLVTTTADSGLKDFINRRKRWGSKTRYYQDIRTKQVAFLVFLANASILACAGLAVINGANLKLAITLFAAKTIVDYGLLAVHFKANGVKKWAKYFVLCAALYPIYITFTAIGSTTSKFTWKERRYNDPKASPPGHSHGEN
jgi:poly-beta-1,6-N-acetyl-D-glucosamine synthase